MLSGIFPELIGLGTRNSSRRLHGPRSISWSARRCGHLLAVPHAWKNDATPAKLITTHVVDMNKPLVSPAPE
jgi:hypothetical protein